MIEVKQLIEVCEVNDEEVPTGKSVQIGVNSHWNDSELVVLKVGRKAYTVRADDLIDAIANAENTNRW